MTIKEIATTGGYILTIAAVITLIGSLLITIKGLVNGQKCMLRSNITDIYYRHIDEPVPTLREHERQNLDDLYDGYHALHGNHYIDDIYKDMREWRVVT